MLTFGKLQNILLATVVTGLFCWPAFAQQQTDRPRRVSEQDRNEYGADQTADLSQENLRRVAAPSAQLILVEATRQGHAATDAYREKVGVPPLEKYWHNCYVDESKYGEWPSHGWRVTQTLSFDTYVLLSKVIYPAAAGPENCTFLSGTNRAAMEMASAFRTSAAAAEIGHSELFSMWASRVQRYDAREGEVLRSWLSRHAAALGDWSHLGHQRLILASAE